MSDSEQTPFKITLVGDGNAGKTIQLAVSEKPKAEPKPRPITEARVLEPSSGIGHRLMAETPIEYHPTELSDYKFKELTDILPVIQEVEEDGCSDDESPGDIPDLVSSSDEEVLTDEEEPAPPVKKEPLVFLLSRDQTRGQVENAILQGVKTLAEKRHLIEGVQVHVQGWEYTSAHPCQIKAAKRKYAEAIEWGLVGFLMANGFVSQAREVYCMAYAKAKFKSKNQIQFKQLKPTHMAETARKSGEAYLQLLEKSGTSDETLARLQILKGEQ